MTTVNLYDILNVPADCSEDEVKLAHKKLAKKYHPDKKGGNAEMYQLITDAYNVLSNSKSRQEYDAIYKLSKQSDTDHFQLKGRSLDFIKSQKTDNKSKKEQDKDFKKIFDEMDRKHNYKRDVEDKPMSSKDIDKMMQDLNVVRQHEDIENIHEKIFDHGRFSNAKFNAAFDAMFGKSNDVIPHQGNPDPWNMVNKGLDANYGTINNYEDLYVEDDGEVLSTAYSSIKADNKPIGKISKEDVDKIKEVDYTDKHNVKDKEYKQMLEDKLKERMAITKKLEDRSMAEFDTDPTCGGYSVFSGIGVTGNNGHLNWEDSDDLKARYNRLLEMRRSEQ